MDKHHRRSQRQFAVRRQQIDGDGTAVAIWLCILINICHFNWNDDIYCAHTHSRCGETLIAMWPNVLFSTASSGFWHLFYYLFRACWCTNGAKNGKWKRLKLEMKFRRWSGNQSRIPRPETRVMNESCHVRFCWCVWFFRVYCIWILNSKNPCNEMSSEHRNSIEMSLDYLFSYLQPFHLAATAILSTRSEFTFIEYITMKS